MSAAQQGPINRFLRPMAPGTMFANATRTPPSSTAGMTARPLLRSMLSQFNQPVLLNVSSHCIEARKAYRVFLKHFGAFMQYSNTSRHCAIDGI
jgi:hypothetical protein